MIEIFRRIIFKTMDWLCRIGLSYKNGVFIDGRLIIRGRPIVQVSEGASINIDDNVTLNSRNYGYHASMHSSVKLMADRPGAVIKIGSNTRVNGACIHAFKKIEIGKNCLIAANVQIVDANGHELSFDNVQNRINTSSEGHAVVIGDNVWIGLNAIILPGVTIGRGAVIGANAIVSGDVPPMVVYAGNPGRIVKAFEET